MKQLLQRLDTGVSELVDAPVPTVSPARVLVKTHNSLISAGTERMLVGFGRANLFEKARRQPDKVRQVLSKMHTDGVSTTLEAVRSKLDTPMPLGYCQAGVVIECGDGVESFQVGDRVVTNGAHAEFVCVPHTLVAKIPESVSFEAAAFTPVAAIGLQGIRLAEPTLGETFVVVGLGLIGLLTVQLLRANGCRVIGVDRDSSRLALGEQFGAITLEAATNTPTKVLALTNGVGADGVLLTLAASSDEPIHQAAEMSRKRGRIVLVGVTGLRLQRDDFYKKELSFQVSCSYGPGRYDPSYEEGGNDYPLPFVRWTEQRNFEAVLNLMAAGVLDPTLLITHRFAFEDAPQAYDLITSETPSLGVVLSYSQKEKRNGPRDQRKVTITPTASRPEKGSIGVVGAGNFAVRTLLPILKAEGAHLHTIASSAGTSGAIAARKFGFEHVATDLDFIFDNPEIDTVFVLTRHDSHARLALRALRARKHVFVEKPLALREDELEEIADAARLSGRMVMVGFNRRFAPHTGEVRKYLEGRVEPLSLILTVNAGAIPRDHWTQDPHIGGGRIIGEACHWLDLARALTDSPIRSIDVTSARNQAGQPIDDLAHLSVLFEDGSTAVVHYLASGSKQFPKERIECFFDGKVLVIDNWRRVQRYGIPGTLFNRKQKMDKGHQNEIKYWLQAVRETGVSPISLDEVFEVSRWAIHAAKRAREIS